MKAEDLVRVQRDIALRTLGASELGETLEVTLDAILEATGLDCGGVYLVDPETGWLVLAHHSGLSDPFVVAVSRFGPDSPRTLLVNRGGSLYTRYEDTRISRDDTRKREGLKAIAIVPIKSGEDIIGCVNVASHEVDEIDDWSREVIETLVGQVGLAVTRSRLDELLRLSEANYRAIFDSANDTIFVHNAATGAILDVNKKMCEMFGCTPGEARGMTVAELSAGVPPYTQEKALHWISKAFDEGPQVFEWLSRDCSGRHFWTEVSLKRAAIGGEDRLLAIVRDITEHRRAEEELRESEERYRLLYDSAGEAIYSYDQELNVTGVNRVACEMFGYESGELLGKNALELNILHPDDMERAASDKRRLFEGEKVVKDRLRFVRKDGSVVIGEVTGAAIYRDGEVVGVTNIVLDITDRVKAEETVRMNAEQLRDLIDIAAHEIRHPAAVLKGYAIMLLAYSDALDSDAVREALLAVNQASDRLAEMVDELLVTSSIERGRLELSLAQADAMKIIATAVEEMSVRGFDNQFNVHATGGTGLVADADRIKHVLVILLDNAARYSGKGKMIDIRFEHRQSEGVFLVADEGPGIPEAHRARVFERFYQVEDTLHHSSPGLGLGLYIAGRIVDAHGGWIVANPRDEGGSVFSFGIPTGVF